MRVPEQRGSERPSVPQPRPLGLPLPGPSPGGEHAIWQPGRRADLPGFNLQGQPCKSPGLIELSRLRRSRQRERAGCEHESNYVTQTLARP